MATKKKAKTSSKGAATAKKSSEKSVKNVKKPSRPVQKSAPKSTPRSTPSVVHEEKQQVVEQPATTTAPEKKAVRVRKSYLFAILGIVLIGALLFFFRSMFVAAVVNGRPISRLAVVKETEKQSGKQALDNLVRNTLIEEEANREHVSVNDKEVDDEVKKVEDTVKKQGQNLDQVLQLQGMTRADLRKLIRLDKLVGKMVGKDIKISDKDVNDFIEKNKESLPQNQNAEQLKASVKDRLKQQQLNEKVQTWLSDLRNKAKIIYFVQY